MNKLSEMGPGAELAKLDVNSGYQNVPVGQILTGYVLARSGICGCGSAFWFEVST